MTDGPGPARTPEAALVRLIGEIRSDPGALRIAAAAARSRGRPGKALPEEEVRRHILALMWALETMLTGTPEEVAAAVTTADGLAVDRAQQGIALSVLLDGVGSARQVLLSVALDVGRRMMPAGDLLDLLAVLDARLNALLNSMVLAYRSAEEALARTTRTARIEALRELLDGGPISWAVEAGLDPSRRYHCLVADVSSPTDARKVDAQLSTAEGVAGIVHGLLCRVSAQLPSADRVPETLVITSPAVRPRELAEVHRLCREALMAQRAGGRTGLHPLTEAALPVAVHGREALGRLLAQELLAALSPQDEFHRLLADTGRTFLEHGSRTEPTAAALHVHQNTVKYRIRRLAELTGGFASPRHPGEALGDAVRWWWALSTWLEPASDPGGI